MRRNKDFRWLAFVLLVGMLFLSACSVNVQKEGNGKDNQVDIKSLVGGIHVSGQADAADLGLPLYPGARLKQKDSDDKGANVNISGFGYGIKVVALEYESDDAPEKILSFYRDQLKKYGSILECRTSSLHVNMNFESDSSKSHSHELKCEGSGNDVELKAGRNDDQHIVSVQPEGKGSSFSLVYVRTHGKDAEI